MGELDMDMRGMKANRRPRIVGIRRIYFDCTDPECGGKFCLFALIETDGDGPYDEYDADEGHIDWIKQGNPKCDRFCPRCGKPAKVRMSATSALTEDEAKMVLGEE